MFRLKIVEGDLLMKAMEILKDVAQSDTLLIFDYSPNRLWLAATDPEDYVHAALVIRSFLFQNDTSFFDCNHQGMFSLDSLMLHGCLDVKKDEDYSITFQTDADERSNFHVLFGKLGLGPPRCVALNKYRVLPSGEATVRHLQQKSFRVVVAMHSVDFREVFLLVSVTLTVTHEQVEFSSGARRWVFPKGRGERECIIAGVGEEEEDGVEIGITLNDLSTFMPAARWSDRAWILHSDASPTMICFSMLGIGGSVRFFFVQDLKL